jgi:hypothetical protein
MNTGVATDEVVFDDFLDPARLHRVQHAGVGHAGAATTVVDGAPRACPSTGTASGAQARLEPGHQQPAAGTRSIPRWTWTCTSRTRPPRWCSPCPPYRPGGGGHRALRAGGPRRVLRPRLLARWRQPHRYATPAQPEPPTRRLVRGPVRRPAHHRGRDARAHLLPRRHVRAPRGPADGPVRVQRARAARGGAPASRRRAGCTSGGTCARPSRADAAGDGFPFDRFEATRAVLRRGGGRAHRRSRARPPLGEPRRGRARLGRRLQGARSRRGPRGGLQPRGRHAGASSSGRRAERPGRTATPPGRTPRWPRPPGGAEGGALCLLPRLQRRQRRHAGEHPRGRRVHPRRHHLPRGAAARWRAAPGLVEQCVLPELPQRGGHRHHGARRARVPAWRHPRRRPAPSAPPAAAPRVRQHPSRVDPSGEGPGSPAEAFRAPPEGVLIDEWVLP